MSGLVGYDSSDEEDLPNGDRHRTSEQAEASTDPHESLLPVTNGPSANGGVPLRSPSNDQAPSDPTQGLSLGPTAPPNTSSTVSSPYANIRSTIQQLTLPTHPNLSIPPSPPTSPPPGLDSKVAHFLDLKRQGIHFNAKLADSSALKNPSLLPQLMESAGLDGADGRDQYASTLPRELWDPDGFPISSYKEGLAKMQQEVAKRQEVERRGLEREFVSRGAERVDIGRGMRGGGRASAAERVMAGLERTGSKEAEKDIRRRKG